MSKSIHDLTPDLISTDPELNRLRNQLLPYMHRICLVFGAKSHGQGFVRAIEQLLTLGISTPEPISTDKMGAFITRGTTEGAGNMKLRVQALLNHIHLILPPEPDEIFDLLCHQYALEVLFELPVKHKSQTP